MALSKKNCEQVSKIIKSNKRQAVTTGQKLVCLRFQADLGLYFAQDNENFDHYKFNRACDVKGF